MRGNIAFNYISRLFAALSTFLFIPFYISILGTDGYSIIALSLIVVSILMILDIGLSAAIAREMARRDVADAERYRVYRVIEKIYFGLLALTTVIGLIVSGPIARNVIGETPVDRNVIAHCLILISVETGLQLMMRFYTSVLTGLERQIQGGIFTVVWTALRNGAVIPVIWLVPDLHIFFLWQMVMTLLAVVALKVHSYRYTSTWPRLPGKFFDIDALRGVRGFAFGMFLISLVSVVNTQLDRILIGSLASMRDLAAYTLSASLGTAMLIAATPIMTAVQPRLTTHFTNGEYEHAWQLFRKASRLVALLVFPLAVIISIYSKMLVIAWTGEEELASIAGSIIPFLVMANVSIALSIIAYATSLANGYTRFNNIVGVCSLFVSIPGYFLAIHFSGILGVAMIYFVIQFASTLIFSWLAMNRFLGGRFLRHHLVNYAVPGLASFAGGMTYAMLISPLQGNRFVMLITLIGGVIFTGIVSAGVSFVFWKIIDARVSSANPNPQKIA